MSGTDWLVVAAVGVVVLLGLRVFLRCRVRYRIGRTELRLQLFGIPIRRVAYDDIEKISKPRRRHGKFQYENWTNTLAGDHRELVIHRRTGLWKKLLITPSNRYEFRKRLETAIAANGGTVMEMEDDAEEAALE